MTGKGNWLTRWISGKPTVDRPAGGNRGSEVEYRHNRDRGLAELANGRVDEAIKELGRAVHLRPDLAEAHVSFGKALIKGRKIEAARAAFERALRLEPECVEATAILATLPSPPLGREDFESGQILHSSMNVHTYKVLQVKRGGFGSVYIVERLENKERVALKTFQSRYLWSDDDRRRFEREAHIWVGLGNHPRVVRAISIDSIEGFLCLVLEYVPGGDLGTLLEKGPLTLKRAVELGIEFCDAMEFVQQHSGLVHRDVKPANCLLTSTGQLKVTDFGLAHTIGDISMNKMGLEGLDPSLASQYSMACGTVPYMSPEQFDAGANLDTTTDIYSFGIMFYQMLTCDLPISGSVAPEHIAENASQYKLSGGPLKFIQHCVERDRSRRPAGFTHVRRELAGLIKSTAPVAARQESRIPSDPRQEMVKKISGLMEEGYSYWALKQFDKALQCYDLGLKLLPTHALFWDCKGAVLRDLKRLEESLACYERALQLEPNNSSHWRGKGCTLHRMGRHEEAIVCAEHTLRISGDDYLTWCNMGQSQMALRRYADALRSFDGALKRAPDDMVSLTCKGEVLLLMGRAAEALKIFDDGLRLSPRDHFLWMGKAGALLKLGQQREAKECLHKAEEFKRT